MAWTAAVRWGAQILTWAITIIVARLLAPSDYGLVGMATVYLGLVTLLSEFGIGAAVVTLRKMTAEQLRVLNGWAVLAGLLGFLASCAAAVPLGAFFSAPDLPLVIVVMGLAFIVTGFQTLPYALMQRDLRFKELAVFEGIKAITTSVFTLALAALGFGYWALVLGALVDAAVFTALVYFRYPVGIARPRLDPVRSAMTFSWQVIVQRLSWYTYSHADFLVIGRVFGTGPLGSYTMAWTLASLPAEKFTTLFGRVTPGVFSAVQDDPRSLKRYFLGLTEGISVLAFPSAIGLAVVAEPLVLVVLGERWAPAIGALRLLSAYGAYRAVTPHLTTLLVVMGDTRLTMYQSLLAAVVLPVTFYLGTSRGIEGVAAGWIYAHPVVLIPLYVRICQRLSMPFTEYLASLFPAFAGSVAMAGVVLAYQRFEPVDIDPVLSLATQIGLGAVVYLGWMALFHRERVERFMRVVREARQAGGPVE